MEEGYITGEYKTGEFHIFNGSSKTENDGRQTVYLDKYSICRKVDEKHVSSKLHFHHNKNEIRIKGAAIGRELCGTCISHFYKTI